MTLIGLWLFIYIQYKHLPLAAAAEVAVPVGQSQSQSQQITEINNADLESIGPLLFQGRTNYCYSYVAADLISQELGERVSPAQLALTYQTFNYQKNKHDTTGEIALKGNGGSATRVIEMIRNRGFCKDSDQYSRYFQTWIEKPKKFALPDPQIPPVQFRARVFENVRVLVSNKNYLRQVDHLGTDCRILNFAKSNNKSAAIYETYYQCASLLKSHDDQSRSAGTQHQGVKLIGPVPWFEGDSQAGGRVWQSGHYIVMPESQDLQSLLQQDLPEPFKGYTLIQINSSGAGRQIASVTESDDEAVGIYTPFKAVGSRKNRGSDYFPDNGQVGKYSMLVNSCQQKLWLPETVKINLKCDFAKQGSLQTHNSDSILGNLDRLLESGKIVGFSHKATEMNHIITVIGRKCSGSKPSDCVYTVRNSAQPNEKFKTAEFILQKGLCLSWLQK
jgi:hypothetical protein